MWRYLPVWQSHKLNNSFMSKARQVHYDIKSTNGFRRQSLPRPFEGKKNFSPANMPHPRYMDGEMLGYYSNLLAREPNVDDSAWNKLISRSKQIYPTLEPKEIALILNSLARVRKVDFELFNLLCNQITEKAHFYSSVHIAMILGAYSKAKIFDSKLINSMIDQIKNRLYEFLTPLEISMVINSISKMPTEYRDKNLLNRLSLHVQCRLMAIPFLPRELGQIAHSFVSMDFDDPQLYMTIAGRISSMIHQATPGEAIKILDAFTRLGKAYLDICHTCVCHVNSQLNFMNPEELAKILFEAGNAFLKTTKPAPHELTDLIYLILTKIMASIQHTSAPQIASILQSVARWNLNIGLSEILTIMSHIRALVKAAAPTSNYPVSNSPKEESTMRNLHQTSTLAREKEIVQGSSKGGAEAISLETATRATKSAHCTWTKGETPYDTTLKGRYTIEDMKAIKTSCVASLGLILKRLKLQYPDICPKKQSSLNSTQSKTDSQVRLVDHSRAISRELPSSTQEYPACTPESHQAQLPGEHSTRTNRLNNQCTKELHQSDPLETAQLLQRIYNEFRLLVMGDPDLVLTDIATSCRILDAYNLIGCKSDELLEKIKDLILSKGFNKQSAMMLRSHLLASGYDPENDVMQVLEEF